MCLKVSSHVFGVDRPDERVWYASCADDLAAATQHSIATEPPPDFLRCHLENS